MKTIILTSSLLLLLISCSKKVEVVELKYTALELEALLHASGPSHEKGKGIVFSEYAPGANHLESKALAYEHLDYFIIGFETTREACNEALRLNQYCARNWLLDRVEGEPILEDYLIKELKAINPKRKIQRAPKHKVEGHGESHAPAQH
jgi:hypothetical protein